MFPLVRASSNYNVMLFGALAVFVSLSMPLSASDFGPRPGAVAGKTRACRRLPHRTDGDRQGSRRHPADPAAWQAGLFQVVRQARCRRQYRDDAGRDLSAAFGDKNRHQRGGDDAGRPRQDCARRSRQQIHPVVCQHEGRRRTQGRDRPPRARSGAAAPSDHDRGSVAAYFRDHLRLLWRGAGEGGL